MTTPSYLEVIDAEKVVLKVNNPKNPAQILAITKIWDVKRAKEIRAIFEDMWSEAKPIELTRYVLLQLEWKETENKFYNVLY